MVNPIMINNLIEHMRRERITLNVIKNQIGKKTQLSEKTHINFFLQPCTMYSIDTRAD